MSKKGFTITEVLIAIVILVFAIAGTLNVYIMSYASWQESIARASLQRTGSITMEKIVRGVRAPLESKKNGIREAESFTISLDGDSIKFRSGIDHRQRSFSLDGNKILYNPNLSLSDNEIIIANDIIDLNFRKLSNKKVAVNIN